ncbi:uncharacterized protein LOC6562240 [Drosophila grimshawi]|uniref:GH10283 n=1 Tax=Drosophila grimshawi TaxID=7222 RepID=B4JAN9_DROGR|nr:uncharacterized protein LOC6562240 [Drosophila grimshawi]EDW03847.1 GH10283 [Drosophila grimshawi]
MNDVKELQWLQQIVPLAYDALKTLANLSTAANTPNTIQTANDSPPGKRRRTIKRTGQTDEVSNRRIWVKQENLSRDVDGLFATTFHQLDDFRSRTGMTPQVFDMLFSLVGEQLNKNSIRRPILPECRLFLTLMYLSNAESILDLSKAFKMGSSTVRAIIQETVEVLWNTLAPAFLPQPAVDDWQRIVAGYQAEWQVPHCLGAVDATLLDISYKSENDIVLLASCDADLNFISIDIATLTDPINNQLDWHQNFGSQLLNGRWTDLLPAKPLPSGEPHTSCVYSFIANTMFPCEHLITPYTDQQLDENQMNFNRLLSRALAGSIDKAFSVLMSRWRVLAQPLRQSPSKAEKIVKAAVVLHNFVKLHDENYAPASYLTELPLISTTRQVPSAWLSGGQQPTVDKNAIMELREHMSGIMACKPESNTFEALVDSVEWTD